MAADGRRTRGQDPGAGTQAGHRGTRAGQEPPVGSHRGVPPPSPEAGAGGREVPPGSGAGEMEARGRPGRRAPHEDRGGASRGARGGAKRAPPAQDREFRPREPDQGLGGRAGHPGLRDGFLEEERRAAVKSPARTGEDPDLPPRGSRVSLLSASGEIRLGGPAQGVGPGTDRSRRGARAPGREIQRWRADARNPGSGSRNSARRREARPGKRPSNAAGSARARVGGGESPCSGRERLAAAASNGARRAFERGRGQAAWPRRRREDALSRSASASSPNSWRLKAQGIWPRPRNGPTTRSSEKS